MSRIRLVVLPLVVAGLSLGIAACGDDDDDDGGDSGGGETSLDMTIGVSLPLSGDLADFGPPGEKAADLAISEINAAIEEVGADHTVEVVKEDNCGAADPQCAVQAQRKLATSDGASCIAGPVGLGRHDPERRVGVDSRGGPADLTVGDPDEITELDDDGFVNRTSPPDSFQGPTLSHVPGRRGARRRRGQDGQHRRSQRRLRHRPGADVQRPPGRTLGGEIGEEVIYDIDLPNYDTEADQIVSGNPDGIVIIDFPETYNKVGPALVRTGNFDTDDHVRHRRSDRRDLADAGEEAANGLRGTAPGAPDDETQAKAFDSRVQGG